MKQETQAIRHGIGTGAGARRPGAFRPEPYIRCRTCGRYLRQTEAVEQRYCSTACAQTFAACPTCGRHFPGGEGFHDLYCSRECATRYTMTRTFGPEPVLVVAEELV